MGPDHTNSMIIFLWKVSWNFLFWTFPFYPLLWLEGGGRYEIHAILYTKEERKKKARKPLTSTLQWKLFAEEVKWLIPAVPFPKAHTHTTYHMVDFYLLVSNIFPFHYYVLLSLGISGDAGKAAYKYRLCQQRGSTACFHLKKPAMHPCSKKGQQHPGLHQAERCQRVEGGELSSLLSTSEAAPAALGPVLGSPVQDIQGLTGGSP